MEQENKPWLKLVVVLLFIGILGFATVMGESGDIEMNLENPKTILLLKLLQGISSILVFVLPSLLFAVFWTKSKISYLGITKGSSITTFFIATTGMLMALPLINWFAGINEKMHLPYFLSDVERWMQNSEAKAELLTKAFTAGTTLDVLFVNIIVIALIAAVSEELFFRGILQSVLKECFRNSHVSVWLAAIIFSAFHMQFYGFVPRMLMGVYLGYLFLWSGSLWVSIAAHFINNGMAVYVMWLANRGVIEADIDKYGSDSNEWVSVVISICMVITSLILIYKKEKTVKIE